MTDVPHAERIVEDSAQKFLGWLAGLSHVDTLKSLRGQLERARLRRARALLREARAPLAGGPRRSSSG